jgi:hypothetical protein
MARKARDRRRLRELLAADEAAERAERESILAVLLGPDPASPGSVNPAEIVAPEPSPERSRGRDEAS